MKSNLIKPNCFNETNCEGCEFKYICGKTSIRKFTKESISESGIITYKVEFSNGKIGFIYKFNDLLHEAFNYFNNEVDYLEEDDDLLEEVEVEEDYEYEDDIPEEIEVEEDYEYEDDIPEEIEVEEDDEYEDDIPEEIEVEEDDEYEDDIPEEIEVEEDDEYEDDDLLEEVELDISLVERGFELSYSIF